MYAIHWGIAKKKSLIWSRRYNAFKESQVLLMSYFRGKKGKKKYS